MSISPIVHELLLLNREKLDQLGTSEKILTSVNLSNDNFPKVKAYNTGLCVFVTSNFNYLLNLPNEYRDQFLSRKICINTEDDIYLTCFNKIISNKLHACISKKTMVETILDVYLKYLQFIENTQELYQEFLKTREEYNINSKKYNVFITKNYFFKKNEPENKRICFEISS